VRQPPQGSSVCQSRNLPLLLAGAALGHAVPGGSIALGLHFLYSHPEAGALVAKAVSKGLNPKAVVPAVIRILDSQREQGQQ